MDAKQTHAEPSKMLPSIMYSKEDILFALSKSTPARIDSYCQAVDEPILKKSASCPAWISWKDHRWYRGRDGSDYHYHQSRYHALNLHSVFYHGTVEWRLFNSHAPCGEAKANIILAMAISAQGINQKYCRSSENAHRGIIRRLPSAPFCCGWDSSVRSTKCADAC